MHPESAETSCISYISYLKARKEIKDQKNYILKSHGMVLFFVWSFFSSWPHEFHGLAHEYAAVL